MSYSYQPQLGRYELINLLASGGMGEVHAARVRGEAGFEKVVAIKRMHPHLAADRRFVQMFLDEARIAASIHSPFVVSTLDLGRDDNGTPYLVMEMVQGASLAQLLDNTADSIEHDVAISVLADAACGLHDAHETRDAEGRPTDLVHRDVSPQNLLVGRDGRVKVSDFGIAKALARLTHTAAGELRGKVGYFSPEQAHGQTLDRRSDVFALGVVAWELLARRALRTFESYEQGLALARQTLNASLADVAPQVPRPLREVVERALRYVPAERYVNAAEFAGALRQQLQCSEQAARSKVAGWVATAQVSSQPKSITHAQDEAPACVRTHVMPPTTDAWPVPATSPQKNRPQAAQHNIEHTSKRSPYFPLILISALLVLLGFGGMYLRQTHHNSHKPLSPARRASSALVKPPKPAAQPTQTSAPTSAVEDAPPTKTLPLKRRPSENPGRKETSPDKTTLPVQEKPNVSDALFQAQNILSDGLKRASTRMEKCTDDCSTTMSAMCMSQCQHKFALDQERAGSLWVKRLQTLERELQGADRDVVTQSLKGARLVTERYVCNRKVMAAYAAATQKGAPINEANERMRNDLRACQ